MKALLLVALVAGCTDFQTIDLGVCGNGVVEPGEDCDSADDSCQACKLLCSPTVACPAGYGCGVDGVCGAPGGQLTEGGALDSLSVRDLRVTDLDKDGTSDLIGLSATSLIERYGDRVAPLARGVSLLTAEQTGAAGFGDLDGDGSLDVMIPTPDGLVGYQSRYGTPSPLQVPFTVTGVSGKAQLVGVFPLQALVFGVLTYDTATPNARVLLSIVDLRETAAPIPHVLCDLAAKAGDVELAGIDVYDASKGSEAQYVVGIPATIGGVRKECVLSIRVDPNPNDAKLGVSSQTIYTLTPAALAVPDKAVLANLDFFGTADPCPSLLVQDHTTSDLLLAAYDGSHTGAGNAAQCTLATKPGNGFPLILDSKANTRLPASSHLIGRIPLVPQISIGFGADALVTDRNFFIYAVNAGYSFYESQRTLKGVASGDVNGDGQTDAVLIPATDDDLDVVLRAHTADGDGYVLYRLDTAAAADTVQVADFDGNGYNDIAYTEIAGDHRRLMVAYSNAAGIQPPTEQATFPTVEQMTPINVPSSLDLLSRCVDLLVTTSGGSAGELLTLLEGSPNPTLTPVYDPRPGGATWTLRDVSIGRFSVDGTIDVFPLGWTPDAGGRVKGFPVANTPIGLVGDHAHDIDMLGFADCQTISATSAQLCDDGDTTTVSVGSYDVVIGIDEHSVGGLLDPNPANMTSSITAQLFPLPDVTKGVRVHNMLTADLDNDGALELIATFAKPDGTTGAVVHCELSMGGMPSHCVDMGDAIRAFDPAVTSCFDAAVGRFAFQGPTDTPPAGSDLVVACLAGSTTSLYRYAPDKTVSLLLATDKAKPVFLRSGDFDGDGAIDLALVHGAPGAQTLTFFHQCTSRECKEAP